MSVEFMKFKFIEKAKETPFFIYQIKSNNPYNEKADYNGNSICYYLRRQREKDNFFYNLNNDCIITMNSITKIPNVDALKDVKLELLGKEKIPVQDYKDLYSEWFKYVLRKRIKENNSLSYDYRVLNQYKKELFTDSKSGIRVSKTFKVDAEVLEDATVYLSVDINCDFESAFSIYDYILNGKNIIGLKVKYMWQDYEATYKITELHNETINQDVNGFNVYEYYRNEEPWRLKGIDPNKTPAVSADGKKRAGLYIPQSLKPVITREFIAENHNCLSKRVDGYTKLSMEKRLNEIRKFLADINSSGKRKIVDENPVSATEFGYKEYSFSENMPKLLVGNNKKISFNQKRNVFKEWYGFYKLPEEPITAAFLSYGNNVKDKESKEYKNADKSHKVVREILHFAQGKIKSPNGDSLNPNMLNLNFYNKAFHYELGEKLSYKEKAREIHNNPEINFVVSVLPLDTDEEYYIDCVDSPYDAYKNVFADLKLPSQMVSIKACNDLGSNAAYYRLENIILGILCKNGGIPWVLEAPMDNVDCFIGIDVGTQEKGIHYPACSVCFDGSGKLIGYNSPSKAQNGEKIDKDSLYDMLDSVLLSYKNNQGAYPNHIVVHRDGFSNEEDYWYEEYFNRKNIEFDLVEIRKNLPARLIERKRAYDKIEMNPKSGTAIINDNEAYLISTEVSSWLGAPRPLKLVHKHGNLKMEQIVRQVYVLSELHVGSMRTSRLPITTLYADKICKHLNHVVHDTFSNKLYFL